MFRICTVIGCKYESGECKWYANCLKMKKKNSTKSCWKRLSVFGRRYIWLLKQNFGEYASNRHEHGCWLTPLAGTGPISCASAVADEAVPALLTHPLVLAGVALTLLPRHLVAGRFDSRSVLLLSDQPDVFTASVNEQVPDAAHVAVVEHGGPELGGQDETCSVLWKSTKVHITL